MLMISFSQKQSGFTIIELLVVIVVIGILAAISIVSYNGVTSKAEEVAVKSDLRNASSQLELYNVEFGAYPASGNDLKTSPGTEFTYTVTAGAYCLSATRTNKPTIIFHLSSNNPNITSGVCPGPTPTAEACFAFSAGQITNYYANEGNNSANPACPRVAVIPSTINGNTVQSIRQYSFESKSLTGVTLPSTVTTIGEYAFSNNQLTSIVLPNSLLTLDTSAFASNAITSITFGTSLTSIGATAFHNNQIAAVTIPQSVTSIGNFAFWINPFTAASVPTATTLGTNSFESKVTVTRY